VSAREVLQTVDGLLADPAMGFVVTLAALIATDPPSVPIVSDTAISRRRPDGQLVNTTRPNLSVNLAGAESTLVQPGQKDGRVQLRARYECFHADEETLELQLAYAAAAFSKMITEYVREYSDAHGGTIVEVADTIGFSFGEFDGPVSAGFIATFTVIERSSE
jgi:hypothetical protein